MMHMYHMYLYLYLSIYTHTRIYIYIVKCQHLISHNHAWQGKRSPCSSNQGMHDPISYTREQCKSSQRYLAQGAFKGVAEGGIDTLEAIVFLVLWLHAVVGETSHRQCDLVKTAARPQPCRCIWLVLGIREPLLPIHNIYIYTHAYISRNARQWMAISGKTFLKYDFQLGLEKAQRARVSRVSRGRERERWME